MSDYSLLLTALSKVAELLGDSNKGFKTTFTSEEERILYLHRFNGELYPKDISRRMLTTSCLILVDSMIALYYEFYLCFLLAFLCCVCSINFWRKPTKGLRRNIDIVCAVSNVSLHLLYVTLMTEWEFSSTYIYLAVMAVILYFMGVWCAGNGYLHLDSYCHCSLHLWGIFWASWGYRQLYHLNEAQRHYS